jgi:type IV pilus assembly protein PilM
MLVEGVAWGVDIGRSSLKAVRMRRLRDTVEINGVDIIDYYGSADEQPSSAEIRQALSQFKQRNKIKATDMVAVAVPGYAAFTRFIKLPPVADKKIADVVKYEAAQQIPFPLSDVVWGFQKVEKPYEPGEEIEVGIFAIREEIVRNYLADFDAAKLHVDVIAIAPLALYNFARYEMDIPDDAVVVDIGADHTDLVVIEGGKFHVRNLALAGNDITKKLSQEFDITFLEAEKLKIKAAQSKQADKLFAVMQPVLRDFTAEIMRSLSFYKSRAKHMVLLGNATKLEGLAKFFASNLDVKINRFFDIVHMELDHDIDLPLLQEHLPSLGVTMGLALQALGRGPSSANLIPQKLYKQRQMERKQPMFILAASLLFLLVLFMYFSASSQESALDAALKDTGQVLESHNKLQKDFKKLKPQEPLQKKAQELVKFARRRNLPIEIVNRLNQAVPANLDLIPGMLKGVFRDEGLYPPYPGDKMDEVNRDKVWLLELDMQPVEGPKEKAGIEVILTAAVVAEGGEMATVQRLNRIFVQNLANEFGVNAESMRVPVEDANIRSLTLDKRHDQNPDGSNQGYYKFRLKWTVPFEKAGEPEPKKAPADESRK